MGGAYGSLPDALQFGGACGLGVGAFLTSFKRGFATPIISIFDLRRNVPYFYDTFWVDKITLVAELNVIPDAPWW